MVIFTSKSDFGKIDINELKDMYKQNDAVSFVFEDNSALVFEEKSNTLHFSHYDDVSMGITVN